ARPVDAGVDQRHVEALAVELPGDAGDVARIEDVEPQGVGPEVAQADPVVLAPVGGEDAPARLDVLAGELEADPPRGPDDQCGRHALSGLRFRVAQTISSAIATASPPPMHSVAM